MKLLVKILIFTLVCVTYTQLHAQFQTPIDGVTISSDTLNPKPGQSMQVSIESFNFDLGAASIVWMVDGKVASQGVGIKTLQVTAPKIGTKLNVSVAIKGADGREIKKAITLTTGSVDIIWESDGYAPPFFEGKLPFSYQNSIRLIAFPHLSKNGAQEIDPKTLVYSWKKDGKYIDGGQGYGKQSVDIEPDDLPRPLNVSVEITNREETEHTIGNITITPSDPGLSFYEEDSLYGILFNKSLTDQVTLKNSEMKILAIPFGFNLNKKDNSYAWTINDIDQPDLLKNRSITVRTKGDTEGSSAVNLDTRNLDNILQGARAGFTVYFNKRQTTDDSVGF